MKKTAQKTAQTSPAEMVDQLGIMLASIAEMEKKSKAIKESLKALGLSEIDGLIFRATVSESSRVTLDSAIVRTYLTAPQIAQCEKVSNVVTVRVVSR